MNWIAKNYNYIILAIFILSIAFLLCNNFQSLAMFNFYESDESYNIGNGIWNNILTGIIGSTVFYWIVQYFPEKSKRNRAYKISINNYKIISKICNDILNEYNQYYFKKSNINNLIDEDFMKIEYYNIHSKIKVKKFMYKFNTNQGEMKYLHDNLKKISNEIDSILQNPYLINKDENFIENLYNFRYNLNSYIFKLNIKIEYYTHTLNEAHPTLKDLPFFIVSKNFKFYKDTVKEKQDLQKLISELYYFHKNCDKIISSSSKQ